MADRFLLIDESITPRLATELKRRRRTSQSLAELTLRGMKDPELLERIANNFPDAVFVTTDDHLPAEHAALLIRFPVTLAIVDSRRGEGFSEEEWKHEIVHRWAHKMVAQPNGTVRRYGSGGAREWRVRKRPILRASIPRRSRLTAAGSTIKSSREAGAAAQQGEFRLT